MADSPKATLKPPVNYIDVQNGLVVGFYLPDLGHGLNLINVGMTLAQALKNLNGVGYVKVDEMLDEVNLGWVSVRQG